MEREIYGSNYVRWLYDAKASLSNRSECHFMLKKLSKEHLGLTSYSRMGVNLAVQVSISDCNTTYIYRY